MYLAGDGVEVDYNDDLWAFAAYKLDSDAFSGSSLSAYCERLEDLGFEEARFKDMNIDRSARQYTSGTDLDIRISGHLSYQNVVTGDREVIIAVPDDCVNDNTYIEDRLPDTMFDGLKKRQVGTYQDGNFDSYIAALERDHELWP